MDATTPADALDRLLLGLEYGTAKEDRPFTDKLFAQFGLHRGTKSELIDQILASPGFEPFFLATLREARPFAIMLKEVYGLLSLFDATSERRASVFRISGEGARATFDFNLESFPKDIMRWVGEIEAAVDILQLQFGSAQDAAGAFSWYTSQTQKLWRAIDPVWDGDFYDGGFHRALSFAGSIVKDATVESRARLEALVVPILDRLRALTATLQWQELGVEKRTLESVARSFITGEAEKLQILVYPTLNSRLERAAAINYLQHPLSEDDGGRAPVLSGPVDEVLWDRVSRTALGASIAIDFWQRRVPRPDRDNWLESKTGKPLHELTAPQYLELLEPLAQQYRAHLDSLIRVVDQESVTELREALIEFFGLPFWKDRWFLYELWTLCRVLNLAKTRWPIALLGVDRRADGVVEWKLPGGLAKAPVAQIGEHGEIQCWTQLKTLHPKTGEGLEPDLRITRATPGHPDVFIVENKDRRKPRTSDMAEILERYVTGTKARCVCLVNYEEFTGPTHKMPRGTTGQEVLILSRFRPLAEPAEFRLRLMQILEEELGIPAVVSESAAKQGKPELIEITLEWHHQPDDLDLHAWVERSDGTHHLSYQDKGSLEATPHALLGDDVVRAPGRESLSVRTEGLVRVLIAVHRFSPGLFGHAAVSVEIRGASAKPHRLELATSSDGAWWHVAEIDGDLSVKVLDVVARDPPAKARN